METRIRYDLNRELAQQRAVIQRLCLELEHFNTANKGSFVANLYCHALHPNQINAYNANIFC